MPDATSYFDGSFNGQQQEDLFQRINTIESPAGVSRGKTLKTDGYGRAYWGAEAAPGSESEANANIAPLEEGPTASQAYAVGDLLVYQGQLMTVVQAIAEGGAITPGTNVMSYTVAQALGDFCPPLTHYDGMNLADRFASEIANYSDFAAWLRARLAAKNLSGIHIKDYFQFTTSNNVTFKARIAGVKHDLGYGDTEVTGWHIDFICDELWPDNHVWNKVNYNNGLATEPSPWLCSDLYHFLNSLSGNVPNGTGADPATVAVDYTSTGVLDKFPAWLRDAIVERRSFEPTRYSAGNLLTDDASWAWKNIGKLWVPSEIEYYGFIAWGTRNGYSIGEGHMYPLLRDSKMRIKRKPNGNRYALWLRRADSGNSARSTSCFDYGYPVYFDCASPWVAPPVCFRISA